MAKKDKNVTAISQPVTPDTMEKSELEYLGFLNNQMAQAKTLLDNYSAYLSAKYKLGQKDTVNFQTGNITRYTCGISEGAVDA